MLEVDAPLLSGLIWRLSVFSHSLLGLLALLLPPSAIRLLGFLDSLTLEDTGVLIRTGVKLSDFPISILSVKILCQTYMSLQKPEASK